MIKDNANIFYGSIFSGRYHIINKFFLSNVFMIFL